MNQCLSVIKVAVLGIGVLARRICDFLLVARSQERLHAIGKGIASEIDEMLCVMPGKRATIFSNTAGPAVEYPAQKILGPFGDW